MAKDALSLAWQDMKRRHFATAIKRLEAKADIYEDNFEILSCERNREKGMLEHYLK